MQRDEMIEIIDKSNAGFFIRQATGLKKPMSIYRDLADSILAKTPKTLSEGEIVVGKTEWMNMTYEQQNHVKSFNQGVRSVQPKPSIDMEQD